MSAAPEKLSVVITTIQQPTASVRALAARLAAEGGDYEIVVVGDRKGPDRYDLPGCRLIPIEEQARLPFALARRLPENHYGRKNLGYLLAREAPCVYETDDDNAPGLHWTRRSPTLSGGSLSRAEGMTEVEPVAAGSEAAAGADPATAVGDEWFNVFRAFADGALWPRGFPLDLVHDPVSLVDHGEEGTVTAPIQQGLVDGEPDVDALWRLLTPTPVRFRRGPAVLVPPGQWCPFNSQSTWWWPSAYPLMYLPCFCSFRMTDIWRSFVAQRCLWELGHGLVFHPPEVVQERNPHDLMRDFRDEVPGYEHNRSIVRALAAVRLEPGDGGVGPNVMRCYERLVADGFLPAEELPLVRAWLADIGTG